MDYSPNPYQQPPQIPRPGGKSSSAGIAMAVFGICLLGLLGVVGMGYAAMSSMSLKPERAAADAPETAHALKTADDGWITYKLDDVGVTVDLPASVETTFEPETKDYLGNVMHEVWGESAYVFFERWDSSRREDHSAKSTADYDLDTHQGWTEKNSLSTKFAKSELGGVPAYYSQHSYKDEGEAYICHAYYLIGSDWFTMIDISYPEADKKKGEAEMQRIVKSMKFSDLKGLIRKL